MMKLFVNLDPLHPPLTGIGQYTYGILEAMLRMTDIPELYGQYGHHWYPREQIETLLTPSVCSDDSFEPSYQQNATFYVKQIVKKIPLVRKTYRQLQSFHLAQHFKVFSTQDAYWEPNYELKPFPGKAIPTIHDIAYIRRPEFHEQSTITHLTQAVPRSIQQAAHLFTVSEFSRQEIIDHYRVDPEFVSVIYPGVSSHFRQHHAVEQQSIRAIYQLPDQFVLSLGTLEPRKNLKGLMQAYLQLPESLKTEYPLVLVGTKGWLTHQFSQEMQLLEKRGQLIRLGYVPQVHLPALISSATVMAYVSHYEGFGMPVAEAMASGTAVLTSVGTSMQEVVADAAYLVKPDCVEDIAQGLVTLLENSSLRDSFVVKGLARVNTFRWDMSAQKMIAVFNQLR
jgi:alpha-1,3-rhamnosyl/mannosyltransferase